MARPLGTRKKPKIRRITAVAECASNPFIFPTAALDNLGEIAQAQANTPGQTTWPNHLAKINGQNNWEASRTTAPRSPRACASFPLMVANVV